MKYDSVLTNVGGAFQPSTGIFTAPCKGIYAFSCSLMSDPSNAVYLEMMKNGKKLSIVYAASGTNPQSAQTLHLLLNKGDKIWIQNYNRSKATIHDHGSYNLFSGSLIAKVWNKSRSYLNHINKTILAIMDNKIYRNTWWISIYANFICVVSTE